ncbi:hypothetical protein AYJ70_23815 [Pseudomonas monteilii]|uniref:Uncharacterized protein n=1 Tax=Pseudomonas monteilii TaxID=76759 RepID=A0AAP7FMB9_9PSED|nr:hypothetical protein HB4184_00445 [Pseudomonas putida]OAH50692.1 hypothetical protein AYJ70_23815 [Pseudomonas monteilii]
MHVCQKRWSICKGPLRPRQFFGQSYDLTQWHAWISPVFKRHSTTVCQWVSIGAWLLNLRWRSERIAASGLQALPVEGAIEMLGRLGGRNIGRQYGGVAA